VIGRIKGSTRKRTDRSDRLIDGRSMVTFDALQNIIHFDPTFSEIYCLFPFVFVTSTFEKKSSTHPPSIEGTMNWQ
jgi:hypothetical protein